MAADYVHELAANLKKNNELRCLHLAFAIMTILWLLDIFEKMQVN